jgi:hypothetical protein
MSVVGGVDYRWEQASDDEACLFTTSIIQLALPGCLNASFNDFSPLCSIYTSTEYDKVSQLPFNV